MGEACPALCRVRSCQPLPLGRGSQTQLRPGPCWARSRAWKEEAVAGTFAACCPGCQAGEGYQRGECVGPFSEPASPDLGLPLFGLEMVWVALWVWCAGECRVLGSSLDPSLTPSPSSPAEPKNGPEWESLVGLPSGVFPGCAQWQRAGAPASGGTTTSHWDLLQATSRWAQPGTIISVCFPKLGGGI